MLGFNRDSTTGERNINVQYKRKEEPENPAIQELGVMICECPMLTKILCDDGSSMDIMHIVVAFKRYLETGENVFLELVALKKIIEEEEKSFGWHDPEFTNEEITLIHKAIHGQTFWDFYDMCSLRQIDFFNALINSQNGKN
jgi:hypothetical protein